MYKIIDNLPIDLDFSTKTTKELRLYREWFYDNKDERLHILTEAINNTEEFESWQMDYTVESLLSLGKWFKSQVSTEKFSEEEYKVQRENIPDYIKISDWDLDIRTRSLIVDIGIYLGEVFIHQYKNLQWEQFITRSKLHADRGQMIICGFGNDCLEPIRIVFNIALSFVKNTKKDDRIYNIYHVWEGYLK